MLGTIRKRVSFEKQVSGEYLENGTEFLKVRLQSFVMIDRADGLPEKFAARGDIHFHRGSVGEPFKIYS